MCSTFTVEVGVSRKYKETELEDLSVENAEMPQTPVAKRSKSDTAPDSVPKQRCFNSDRKEQFEWLEYNEQRRKKCFAQSDGWNILESAENYIRCGSLRGQQKGFNCER